MKLDETIAQRLGPQTFQAGCGVVHLARCMATGSRAFRVAAPDSDQDWIVYVPEWLKGGTVAALMVAGFSLDADVYPTSQFVSLRRYSDNLLLSSSEDFVRRWIVAHDECCAAKPVTRAERIKIFRKHLYNEV